MEYGDFRDRTTDMFDFTCSEAYRGYFTQQFGYPSEQLSMAQRPPTDMLPISEDRWTKRQQYQIDQYRAEVVHLRGKVDALLRAQVKKPLPKPAQKKTGYTGLVIPTPTNKGGV